MSRLELFWILYASFAVAFTLLELLRPARRVRYLRLDATPLDAFSLVTYQFLVYRIASRVSGPLGHYLRPVGAILHLPLPLRVLAYYLLADCGSYWMHRLMHTRHVWRVHKWHHAPRQIYWLSGVRATIPQQVLFNLPYVLAAPLLGGAPGWLFIALTVESIFRNNWMHMNVAWRSNWLEWVFVTPRYHHIHHSADAALHDGNYGSLFSIWDRLFGTYIDPDTTAPVAFGNGEPEAVRIRWLLGI